MAYDLQLTRRAHRQLERLLGSASGAIRRNLGRALTILQSNPYPRNPDLTAGTIRQLRGSRKWRFKVDHHYRMVYRIEGRTVTVERIVHRRDAYRDL